jgi:bifunctional non-homologous end joining protein LigD
MAKTEAVEIEAAGRAVRVSNPSKVWFPEAGITKLEVVRYYLSVAEGALRGVRGRPMQLERYVDGIGGPLFYQKRAPDKGRPEWIETVTLRFPSMRTADELVVRDAAQLLWVVNLACLSLHPHPVRAEDLDHPDELRIDLDPVPGVPFDEVKAVARGARDLLAEHGMATFPKTSGSRGIHLLVRLQPRWTFPEVRTAALAVAREVERRMPGRATAKWWKEDRQGVFLDYNQNAKDRTTASAYSVRAKPDARVSTPFRWEELDALDPAAFTLRTVPARFAAEGDPHAAIDDVAHDLGPLLQLAAAQGEGDAPWPPHFPKAEGEPDRVAPSRKRKAPAEGASSGTGRRKPTKPLRIVAESTDEAAARAGLERWKAAHPDVVPHLHEADVLVDKMRGRSSPWFRIRVNLEHAPAELHPPAARPDPDDAPKLPWGPPREEPS